MPVTKGKSVISYKLGSDKFGLIAIRNSIGLKVHSKILISYS